MVHPSQSSVVDEDPSRCAVVLHVWDLSIAGTSAKWVSLDTGLLDVATAS
jgi:hypothetical protein